MAPRKNRGKKGQKDTNNGTTKTTTTSTAATSATTTTTPPATRSTAPTLFALGDDGWPPAAAYQAINKEPVRHPRYHLRKAVIAAKARKEAAAAKKKAAAEKKRKNKGKKKAVADEEDEEEEEEEGEEAEKNPQGGEEEVNDGDAAEGEQDGATDGNQEDAAAVKQEDDEELPDYEDESPDSGGPVPNSPPAPPDQVIASIESDDNEEAGPAILAPNDAPQRRGSNASTPLMEVDEVSPGNTPIFSEEALGQPIVVTEEDPAETGNQGNNVEANDDVMADAEDDVMAGADNGDNETHEPTPFETEAEDEDEVMSDDGTATNLNTPRNVSGYIAGASHDSEPEVMAEDTSQHLPSSGKKRRHDDDEDESQSRPSSQKKRKSQL